MKMGCSSIYLQNPQSMICSFPRRKRTLLSSFSSVQSRVRSQAIHSFASSGNLNQQRPISTSSTDNQAQEREADVSGVRFQTLGACKLGISWYPDFVYNADGGVGTGIGRKLSSYNLQDEITAVNFDLETIYIPSLTSATTRFLGLPLPPFLKIDIVPELLQGSINQESGEVELEFKAKFLFSAGSIYKAPPLLVETVLTSEESEGIIRSGRGERLDKHGRCRLVGVATVPPINDWFMNSFLRLPTECLADLSAAITFSSS